MSRRLLAMGLSIVMLLSLCPFAMAAGTAPAIVSVSAGNYHALAVDDGGGLWGWGWNNELQLGDSSLDNSGGDANGPYQTIPAKLMEDVADTWAGSRTSAALKTDGSLWLWGGGETPHLWMEGVKTATLDQSLDGGAAVTEDGALWLWGESTLKLLGLEPSDTPVKMMEDVRDVQLWGGGIYVLKTDGSLVAEQQEPLLEQVEKITMGSELLLALKTDGTLWGCYSYEPLAPMMEAVSDMAAGHGSSYIVKTDGTLWACGGNQFGELGNGKPGEGQEDFAEILTDVVQVEAGDCYAIARKADGTLWSWGVNSEGQLGNGGKGNGASIIGPTQSVPIQVDFTQVTLPVETLIAYPGVSFAIMVDDRWAHLSLYGLKNEAGDRNYYVRLRDVAAELSETKAAFDVGYDAEHGVIALTTGERYRARTGDEVIPFAGVQAAQRGGSRVTVDGAAAELDCFTLTDSAGGGHTYFKLRDLGKALGFNVRWDSTYRYDYLDVHGRILIETDRPYSPG